jgi:hypothetical protein
MDFRDHMLAAGIGSEFKHHIPAMFGLSARTMHFRNFKPIKAGNYNVSIQASENHYCSPRKTLEDIFEYYSFEVAIWQGEDGPMLNIQEIPFPIPHAEYWGEDIVGAGVPAVAVQEIVDALCDAGQTETEHEYVHPEPNED